MTSLQITAAPGYSALPSCAQFGFSWAIADVYWPLCQSKDAPSVYISCLCDSEYSSVYNTINNIITGAVDACGTPQIQSAQTVLSNYCQANADNVLFTSLSTPGFGSTTTTSPTTSATSSYATSSFTGSTPTTTTSSKSVSAGAIAGIVVACVVVAALLSAGAIVLCIKRRGRQKKIEEQRNEYELRMRGLTGTGEHTNGTTFLPTPAGTAAGPAADNSTLYSGPRTSYLRP